MFTKAYKIASEFCRPVVISFRYIDGTIDNGISAFTLLNKEGWIITVEHIIRPLLIKQQHDREIAEYQKKIKEIEENKDLKINQKNKKIRKLNKNNKWITNLSLWWGRDDLKVAEIKALSEADFAAIRLEPSTPFETLTTFPIIKNPKDLAPGTSLCKLGFPFYKIDVSFDENKKLFIFAPNSLPIPRFPIEGIFTRNIHAGKSKDGKYDIKFIETSSPGLRGQSGGPIFDANGVVWGIQSRTNHLPLGFSPKIKKGNKEIEENQFLNVGIGVHPELIFTFLKDNNIKFTESDN